MQPAGPRRGSRFEIYLLPAIIAQSAIIGGGYATGREVTQYAGRFGPPGWTAVALITVGFAAVAILSFELARIGQAYDYKRWIRLLIGPLWPLFDLIFVAMALLIIAVMAAAIGSVLRQTLGLATWTGLLLAFAGVGLATWRGARFIERWKSVGSVALYVAYIAFSILVLTAPLSEATTAPPAGEPLQATPLEVAISALQYIGYNLGTFPVTLFCLYRLRTRGQAVGSGVVTGIAMTVPFALTFLCLLRFWPDPAVLGAEVPWLQMLEAAARGPGGVTLWTVVFGVVAGWTLLETAVAAIHAIVDRVEKNTNDLPVRLRPRAGGLAPWQRALLSVALLGAATLLARVGIIDLVARGYGLMAWGYIVLLLVPLCTRGVFLMVRHGRAAGAA